MPALLPTSFAAEILWLGQVADMQRDALLSIPEAELSLGFDGLAGAHAGVTRRSCSRVTAQYPKGTPIRNERQLSIVSEEELAEIARRLKLDSIDPARLGASMVVRGIPDFTRVPPSSRLIAPSGASLVVNMENRPCIFPARSIEKASRGHGKGFKAAANGLRGVTAWVEREGRVAIGDHLTLHIPDQPPWMYLDEARETGNA